MDAADFFVSYSQSDRSWAEWIAWQLEAAGYRVVIQAWDFSPGSNFIVEMDKAARVSARTIAVLSPDYLGSRFATAEWAAALANDPTGERRKLLPVRVAGDFPQGLLANIIWVDFVDCDETIAADRLHAAAAGTRAKPIRKPAFPGGAEGVKTTKPRFPTTLPPIWNVPARNRHFMGRKELLAQLEPKLSSAERIVVTQALAGLGGIGKSQLAIEYAYRNAARYQLVWWIRAETQEARHADLLALGKQLSLSVDASTPVDGQITLLRAWLEQHDNWLLVFDNVETPDDLQNLMPHIGAGHVIITSRYRAWGSVAEVMNLGLWTEDEAATYLVKRTGFEEGAAELANSLGYLPLAIEQAAAYVDEARITLGQYSELFQTSRSRMLGASSGKATVATIWSLSFRAVESRSANAVTLLQLLAFLPPDSFLRARLRRRGLGMPVLIADLLESDLALNEAISVLRRYSLAEATPDTISVHRLVQAVVKEALSDNKHRLFAEAALRIQHGTAEVSDEDSPPFEVESRESNSAATIDKRWVSGTTRARRLTLIAVAASVVIGAFALMPFRLQKTTSDARQFLVRANESMLRVLIQSNEIGWLQSTNITEDTERMAERVNRQFTDTIAGFAKDAASFDNVYVPPDQRRQLDLLKLALEKVSPSEPREAEELSTLSAGLEAEYGRGKWCTERANADSCMNIEDIASAMATVRDPKRLREVWEGWHTIAPPMRQRYIRFVVLANRGQRTRLR